MRFLRGPLKSFGFLTLLAAAALPSEAVFAAGRPGSAGDGLVPDTALDDLLVTADTRPPVSLNEMASLHVDRRLLLADGRIRITDDLDPTEEEAAPEPIPDPLESVNRAFFQLNDKLYFWLLKPVARAYRYVFPEPLRVGFRNAFTNLATPVRAVNCLLQGDLKGVGTELLRFLVNSTMGVLGFGDAAKEVFWIERRDEDLGQTLGVYGLGPGFYICWPVLGPSSVRDTLGLAGDVFLDPLNYLVSPTEIRAGIKGVDRVNSTSLSLGDYESLKKAAVDPYVAVRDAYFQYRQTKIKTGPAPNAPPPSSEL